jgi:hypothetical protein
VQASVQRPAIGRQAGVGTLPAEMPTPHPRPPIADLIAAHRYQLPLVREIDPVERRRAEHERQRARVAASLAAVAGTPTEADDGA